MLRTLKGDRIFAGFGDKDPTQFADAHLQKEKLPIESFEAAEFLVLGTLELAYPQTRSAIFHALELADQYDVKFFSMSIGDPCFGTIQKKLYH